MGLIQEKSIDAQVNDYLLTASGHLKESKLPVDVRKVATYGAAASSMMVMMSQAEAAVVFNGGDAPPIAVANGVGTTSLSNSSVGAAQFDLDGDGNNDFAVWGYGSTGYSGGNNGMAAAFGTYESSNSAFGGGSDDLPKLSAGFTLGPSISTGSWTNSVMSTGNDIVFGPGNGAGSGWTGGVDEVGFVGVKFENASGTHYGWVCLQSDPTPGSELIQVNGYAYESTPDTAIQVGDTGAGIVACSTSVSPPTPGEATAIPVMAPVVYGLTSLALGGLGLAGLRRRREDRAARDAQR